MRPIDRFINNARNISKNPLTYESNEYKQFFTMICKGLFNAEFVEVFSSHIFPETLVSKDGSKYLIWDSAYWYIIYNILNLYFLINYASDDESYACLEKHMEAHLFYFLSLKTEEYPALSAEAARSYADLIKVKYQYELGLEQVDNCNNLISEALFIAKIYCLFHELNHMDCLGDSNHFRENADIQASLYEIANELLADDFSILERLRRYFSETDMRSAIQQIVNRENPSLEVELICDMTSFYDTIDFFKDVWPELSIDVIFSRVNEIVLIMNSINLSFTQVYQHWTYLYKLCLSEIDAEKQGSIIAQSNKDTFLRYILSDLVKSIDANERYGEQVVEMLNTDYFGLRYQTEHSFSEEVMRYITDKALFAEVYFNTTKYTDVKKSKIEELRNTILGWQ